jgi:hypothetical protein
MGDLRARSFAEKFTEMGAKTCDLEKAFCKLVLTHSFFPDFQQIVEALDLTKEVIEKVRPSSCGQCGGTGSIIARLVKAHSYEWWLKMKNGNEEKAKWSYSYEKNISFKIKAGFAFGCNCPLGLKTSKGTETWNDKYHSEYFEKFSMSR